MVEAAGRTLGVELPRLYVDLLRVQNGGYTSETCNAFPTQQQTSWGEGHVPFESVRGIGPADAQQFARGILDNDYYVEEWALPDGLVLLTGDGHWWIALDYRRTGPEAEPSVCWFDTDEGDSVELAPSFDDFVRGLRPLADFEVEDELDLDRPPDSGYLGGALSGEIDFMEQDLEFLQAGSRSLDNTKQWCAQRAAGALELLPAEQTAGLAAALESIEQAADEEAYANALPEVVRELRALIPAWIEAGGPGSALDRAYLDDRGEL
jgi:hypothetical protein